MEAFDLGQMMGGIFLMVILIWAGFRLGNKIKGKKRR